MFQQPGDQLPGKLFVVVPAVRAVGLGAAGLVLPAAGVHLVDVHRAVAAFVAALHPCAVVKVKVQLCQTAGRAGAQLGGKGVGVAAHHNAAVGTVDPVFIKFALRKAGDKGTPHAGVGAFHGHACFPAVKAAADLNGGGAGRPDCKTPAFGTVGGAGVCAEDAVGVETFALEKLTGNGGVIHAKISLYSMIVSALGAAVDRNHLGNLSNEIEIKTGTVAGILGDS